MFEEPRIMALAQDMARHAAARQNVISRNMANADTPGYAAQDIAAFSDVWQQLEAARDGTEGMRQTRAGHLAGGDDFSALAARNRPGAAEGAPNGNGVGLETEMVNAVETRRAHDLALAIYRSSITVLRNALGRS